MESRIEIINLITEKENLEKALAQLIYGSIERREKDNRKYIYVHYRDKGISQTRYIDEFSEELYNLILNNNLKAKEIKKSIRAIDKKLKSLGYDENLIDTNIASNIDFARRHIVETIYNQAVLEGIATTYADTETIVEGGIVNNMTADDIRKVLNLKRAWEFILNEGVICSPTNMALLCEINKFVIEGFYYNAGKVRTTPVKIGGTAWVSELPIESVIKEELQDIINSELSVVDKAIELLLFVMKKQVFIDGNKRTAVIFANHLLISQACGLIVIPNEKVDIYKKLLIEYYEGKEEKAIKEFLKDECYRAI